MFTNPFTNVYGFARTLLALGTMLTFICNDVHTLFRPALGIEEYPICRGMAESISLFCLFQSDLHLGKWVAIVILAAVVTGWRPRFTGVFHWWVSYSFMNSAILVDGGDQVTAIITLLLLPMCICDPRKWHWSNDYADELSTNSTYRFIVGNCTIRVIRVQVAIIYLHAAVAKCTVPEWANGTALYYWFTDPMFGFSSWLAPFFTPLIENPFTVSVLTWSVVTLEFMLFAGLLADKKLWPTLLYLGLVFHFGIALIHGLISFAFAMFAALIIYLRPVEHVFSLPLTKELDHASSVADAHQQMSR
jgi:antimicrobial peptide system SdpB family protein